MSELTRVQFSTHLREMAEAKRTEGYYAYRDAVLAHDAALRAKVEMYQKGYEDQVALKERHEAGYRETIAQLQSQLATLTAERDRLREALGELYTYQNGCPLPGYKQGWEHAMELSDNALRGEGGMI